MALERLIWKVKEYEEFRDAVEMFVANAFQKAKEQARDTLSTIDCVLLMTKIAREERISSPATSR